MPGTLDPLASGILPLAFGEATKMVAHMMDQEKAYRFTLVFGEKRTTDDAEGDVTATSDIRPDRESILKALPHFMGTIEQMPPIFSALKVQGQRAYDLARAGKEVELSPRQVWIRELRLIDQSDPNRAIFEVHSGKGVYIRALARDIAQYLGSCGYAADLRRLKVGPFSLEKAISLDRLKELGHIAPALMQYLLPVETALDDIPALALTGPEAKSLQSGLAVGFTSKPDLGRLPGLQSGMLIRAMAGEKLLALVRF